MRIRLCFIATALYLLVPNEVWACATCFGAPDDPQTKGMNMAILTLLGVTYTLFGVMIAAALIIWRAGKRRAALEEAAENPAETDTDDWEKCHG